MFGDKNPYVIGLLGLGLGLMLDSLIASLRIQTDRIKDIALYQNSLYLTLILFVVIILVVIAIYLFKIR